MNKTNLLIKIMTLKVIEKKTESQLESWSMYVDVKNLLRKLKLTGVNVSKYSDFLVGKHYTLTESEFNEIKEFYVKHNTIQQTG